MSPWVCDHQERDECGKGRHEATKDKPGPTTLHISVAISLGDESFVAGVVHLSHHECPNSSPASTVAPPTIQVPLSFFKALSGIISLISLLVC